MKFGAHHGTAGEARERIKTRVLSDSGALDVSYGNRGQPVKHVSPQKQRLRILESEVCFLKSHVAV